MIGESVVKGQRVTEGGGRNMGMAQLTWTGV